MVVGHDDHLNDNKRKKYLLMEMKTLPVEGLVKAEQIFNALCIKRTTFFNLVKNGNFPKPVKLGAKISVWDVAVVRKYISDLGKTKYT